jgi:hypothetical protein
MDMPVGAGSKSASFEIQYASVPVDFGTHIVQFRDDSKVTHSNDKCAQIGGYLSSSGIRAITLCDLVANRLPDRGCDVRAEITGVDNAVCSAASA